MHYPSSERRRAAFVSLGLVTTLAVSAGCGAQNEQTKTCYSMPVNSNNPEIDTLVQKNRKKYQTITNHLAAAAVVYLGIPSDRVTKDFDGWNNTASNLKTTLYNKHLAINPEVNVVDLPKTTDVFGFAIVWRDANDRLKGGSIQAFPDGTRAYNSELKRDTDIHYNDGFAELDCLTGETIKTY